MRSVALWLMLSLSAVAHASSPLGAYRSHRADGRSWLFESERGERLRITPYGDHTVRVQAAAAGEAWVADDLYQMVRTHASSTTLALSDQGSYYSLSTASIEVRVQKTPLRVSYYSGGTLLTASQGISTADRPLELRINGVAAAAPMTFAPTGGWDRFGTTTQSVMLSAGNNTVRLAATGASGANVDRLRIGATLYEAEAATRVGGTLSTQYPGYSGTGYVDFQNDSGDSLQWTVNVASSGLYTLEVRYANGGSASETLVPDAGEHFAGLGHGGYGRVDKLDLRGSVISRVRVVQSPLIVPFYFSSRGYGVFLNSMFKNTFSFLPADYHFEVQNAQLDYFLIAGPALPDILDRYTQLTGRPRLPPLSAFGLGLSDKIGDPLPSNDQWWRDRVAQMRAGGWPFDLIIHDNCWRGGKTAPWKWDHSRYPDPHAFEIFSRKNGVASMLDFNRADAPLSSGWQAGLALPGTTEWPDFSSAQVRGWFWNLLWTESFDPALDYPGGMLWLDEFDEDVTPSAPLANGRRWEEMGAYYFFLLAQTVGEGWDQSFAGARRPYFMARGMGAGAQRWASLWSGDIDNSYAEMKLQIRGMQAAGLSGFPFWAHDAGGFHVLPSDLMYRRWAVAMGSFSPLWKPHGIGLRFPWQFSPAAQSDMRTFGNLRMALMPYLYSHAYAAHASGAPIARPMFLDWPSDPIAWQRDLQYMWGRELLVAPATDDSGQVELWLPPGRWYDFWDDTVLDGPALLTRSSPASTLALFARAGAIIPQAKPMSSTATWDKSMLVLQVYRGADGRFDLHDDDGISEGHDSGARTLTPITWDDASFTLTIGPSSGSYPGAPASRAYQIQFHAQSQPLTLYANGQPLANVTWDPITHRLSAEVPAAQVGSPLVISTQAAPPGDLAGAVEPADGGTIPGGAAAGCQCDLARRGTASPALLLLLISGWIFGRRCLRDRLRRTT